MDQQQMSRLCGMEDALCRLIRLYCAQHSSEKEIADWFSEIEFEALRPEVSCMAAAMASANDYIGAPGNLIPRLRGIMKYVHTLNSGMTAGMCALGKYCSDAGIPVELFGSSAVHLGYPNPPQRHLWRMEIRVSETDFPQVTALAEHAGFTVEQTPYSATARHGNTQCVLIRKGTEPAQAMSTLAVGGVSFLMPYGTHLLIDLAEAVFQILSGAAPGAKLLPWFMDLHCVITSITDWEAAAVAAAERGVAPQVRLVLELYNSLVPNILSGRIPELFGTEEAALHLAQLLLEYRDLKPGSAKLKRLWILAQFKSGGSSFTALGPFLTTLLQTFARKLTPGN